jgi:hypothetical protein
MLPFFFFFFDDVAFADLVGATASGISSSVAGGDEREDSESLMLAASAFVGCWWVGFAGGGGRDMEMNEARLGTHEVILSR